MPRLILSNARTLMYEIETSCAPAHYRLASEWIQPEEPIVRWFARPSRLGKDFIKHVTPERPRRRGRRYESGLNLASTHITAVSNARSVAGEQSLEKRFREHADTWERQTAFLSATPMRVLHDSYQSIMAMGPAVVPILLCDLQKTRRHWFWALRHLTNVDPVPEKDKGNVDKMIAAWVEWGRREGKT